jgi:glycosyltransferase involved in cell wall biosynthesis
LSWESCGSMSDNLSLVSIVTPSYNQGAFIEETILSVLSQDYPRIEYIVADGGSTDGTLDVLKKYEDRLIWSSESDEGQSDAINRGFQKSRGEILAWLNSDDVYLPGAVRTAADYLTAHPEVAMVYGDCNMIDEQGQVVGWSIWVEDFDLRRLVEDLDYIYQPATFFRRQAFEDVGMLDIGLHYCMDYDFWIRIGKKYPVRHISRVLANGRVYPHTKTARGGEDRWREVFEVSQRHGGGIFAPRYHHAERAYYYTRSGLRRLGKGKVKEAMACFNEALESWPAVNLSVLAAAGAKILRYRRLSSAARGSTSGGFNI